jgi:hypothetical protein
LSVGTGTEYSALLDFKELCPLDDVEANYAMEYTCTAKRLRFGDKDVPVRTGDREFAAKLWVLA